MAHHSKFPSVNLNKSYGKATAPSSTSGYGNGRPRSAGGGGGMVVLSRPRSSSGFAAHKISPRLVVPPPVNLPSLRREHERLDSASSKPSSGHGCSGHGTGHGPSIGWSKSAPPSGEQRSMAGDARPQVVAEKAVILKGEDFPSLMAISSTSSKLKQRQIGENSDRWEEKSELSSVLDMRPQMRSSALIRSSVHGSDGGQRRSATHSMGRSKQEDSSFAASFPLVRPRHTSDWDDDERDRNPRVSTFGDHDGRFIPENEHRSFLQWDSDRGDFHQRGFMSSKNLDRDSSSRSAAVQPSRDLPASAIRDHWGLRNSSLSRGKSKDYSHSQLFNGERREFTEVSRDRAEVSNNWQRGNFYSNGVNANDSMKSFPLNDLRKEKLTSNAGKSYMEDAFLGGNGPLSTDAMLDLNPKVFKKKKDATLKPSEFFDPVRESFEAELERVQQLQEMERQRVIEEQTKAMEAARREAEERERKMREEEDRRRFLEKEAKEAAWRAEQEKLESARRTEEQRLAIKEEKKMILMEEERRKEAARQKLLELEARIAKRQIEAAASDSKDDRIKEIEFARDVEADWEKTEINAEPLCDSSFVKRMPEAGFRSQTSIDQMGMHENNRGEVRNDIYKVQDQDDGYLRSRHDAFYPKKGYRGADFDQCNGSSNIETSFNEWNHGHFNGSQISPYFQRSFPNNEVEDPGSFSRARHNLRQPRVPPPLFLSSSHHKSLYRSEGPYSSLSVDKDDRIDTAGRKEETDVQAVYNCRYQQIISEPDSTELLEVAANSLLQAEDKNSPRYDSQSSLSVSSPPSSPTQHSHDELDDCGGSPALTISVEDENVAYAGNKHMMEELYVRHMDSDTIHSTEEDGWYLNNNREINNGDHVDVHDRYEEDDEIYESSRPDKLKVTNLHDDSETIAEKPDIDACPQLVTSGHDPLKEVPYTDMASINVVNLIHATSELVPTDSSTDNLQFMDPFTGDVIKVSSEEKDVIFDPISAVVNFPDSIGALKRSAQSPIESKTSSLCSDAASVPKCPDEEPARLQFGLFSGPPLIPSPLPTIQIGSIQMPLPLLDQSDCYSSQSQLFQFGQINWHKAPITQSFFQNASQGMPSMKTINQNSVFSQSSTAINTVEKIPFFPADNQPGSAAETFSYSLKNMDSEQSITTVNILRDKVLKQQSRITSDASDDKKVAGNMFPTPVNFGNMYFRSGINSRRMRGRPHAESPSNRNSEVVYRAPRMISEIRGNRFSYNERNSSSVPTHTRTGNSFAYPYQHQRKGRRFFPGTEYRVKDSDQARPMSCSDFYNHGRRNGKPNYGNISSRNLGRKDHAFSRPTKLNDEEIASGSQIGNGVDCNMSRADRTESVLKLNESKSDNFRSGEGSSKTAKLLEGDDIEAPMQSGIVRVFNQPGIEASADGDGFIEVRSKRKISNERRGQKEREINPNFKVIKVPQRHRSSIFSSGADVTNAHHVKSVPFSKKSVMEGQTMAPIGTPSSAVLDQNIRNLRSTQIGTDGGRANDEAKHIQSLIFDSNIISHDKVSVPLGTWGTVHLKQQALNSTLPQLADDLSSPDNDTLAADKASLDDSKCAASSMTDRKPLFSSADQLNYSFSGEKIQFGAVALPATPPSSGESISGGIWPSSSAILNSSTIHLEDDRSNFYDKDKCSSDSCTLFDDKEAEAEAAASAVAVAAISNDDLPLSALGAGSSSRKNAKGHGAPGGGRFSNAFGHSASQEPLAVSLPADLSIDTSHSLWPSLPSIHSSHPLLSHIAAPQSFQFFDQNPMRGGPLFTLRAQDEACGTQMQPQQNTNFGSMPMEAWSQCRAGADSFYGSPTGLPAPFMSPSGGLQGVHSHPHMVFYNHFAPVGQFGQIGLSYMGTTYIPTGKQSDWKHSSEAPAVSFNKACGPSNLNIIYGQHEVTHGPSSSQHLSSGMAINPTATSPFPMINFRPLQPHVEASVPANWPTLPHPSSLSVRHAPALEHLQSLPAIEPHSAASGLPDELGLLDSTLSNPTSSIAGLNEGGIQNPISHQASSPAQQLLGPIGKADHMRGAPGLKTSSGGEWRRRNALPGKHRSSGGADKISGVAKLKQVYVAKSGHAASSG